ncbi:MAG: MBL fold metallo-hydrolase [Ruminococcaceae bacterium]|nr:MBL fold metallo-hydrolase [Oscillospiraceae bacterium]
MKIIVLSENTCSCRDYKSEHGLSLYIETDGQKILFDMGQSDIFLRNSEKLGIDLSSVNFAVLSHGHYDHGGGLGAFLKKNDSAPVYINSHAFEPHYNGSGKYNGLDRELLRYERIIFVDDKTCLGNGICVDPCKEMKIIRNFDNFGLGMLENDVIIADDFRHEQYLIIEEYGKRILISGCSHRGVINILNHYRPDVFVGGFHFFKMDPGEELLSMAKELKKYSAIYYTCHCTGREQFDFIKNEVPYLNYISAGDVIDI